MALGAIALRGGFVKYPAMILATDPVCKTHNPGRGHPEQIARYAAVYDALNAGGIVGNSDRLFAFAGYP